MEGSREGGSEVVEQKDISTYGCGVKRIEIRTLTKTRIIKRHGVDGMAPHPHCCFPHALYLHNDSLVFVTR